MQKLLKELIMINNKKKTIKIIFNLNGRTKYVERYLEMIKKNYHTYNFFDILIINERGCKLVKKKFKVINTKALKKINGMNDIFREILEKKIILNNYKYCCFVEDDNFIFPNSLFNSQKFLEKNNDYIACSGESFIFSKFDKQYFYLNSYSSPNTVNDENVDTRFKSYNKALCYYNLFRKEFFFKILKKICLISDDNISEVFFNFLTVKFGKIKKLDGIYLAREYPRPKIYNIPNKKEWIRNIDLIKDINTVIKKIDSNNVNNLSDNSIFKYLSLRFFQNKKITIFDRIIIYLKKKIFYLNNVFIINKFINDLKLI